MLIFFMRADVICGEVNRAAVCLFTIDCFIQLIEIIVAQILLSRRHDAVFQDVVNVVLQSSCWLRVFLSMELGR